MPDRPDVAVVVAHHDGAVRDRLINVLSAPGSGIVVVGAAAERGPAHALIRRIVPDVALLAPGGPTDGLALASQLLDEVPCCRVLLVVAGSDAVPSRPVPGTLGVVTADARGPAIAAVRAAARDEAWPPAPWALALATAAGDAALDELDRRILDALAEGADPSVVAARARVSRHVAGRRVADALVRAGTPAPADEVR